MEDAKKLKLSKLGKVLTVPGLMITGVATALMAFVLQGPGKLFALLFLVVILILAGNGKPDYVELNGNEISYICYKAIKSKFEIRSKRFRNLVWGGGSHRAGSQ